MGRYFKHKQIEDFLKKLEEDTAYLVNVSVHPNNPIHRSILVVGFHSGAYTYLYNNTCDVNTLDNVYFIEVIRKLCPMKNESICDLPKISALTIRK